MLANAKIKRYVTYGEYPDEEAKKLLSEVGIDFVKLDMPEEKINCLG
jgi:hypothetical protein